MMNTAEWEIELYNVVQKYVDCMVDNEQRLMLHPIVPEPRAKVTELYSNPWIKNIQQVISKSPYCLEVSRQIFEKVLQDHRHTFTEYNHQVLFSNTINRIFFNTTPGTDE